MKSHELQVDSHKDKKRVGRGIAAGPFIFRSAELPSICATCDFLTRTKDTPQRKQD